jgi:hypothetical protein
MRNIALRIGYETRGARANRGLRSKRQTFPAFFALSNCAAKNNYPGINALPRQTA